MSQRNARLIGGIYRLGQVITAGGMLTISTAYNRNTNDMVGLSIIEISPTILPQTVQQLLQTLEQRRSIQSPHVLRVHNWGIDGSRVYIATDPPHGITLQYVLNTENISIQRALDLSQQIAAGLKLLHEQRLSGHDLRPQLITVDSAGVTDLVQIDDIGLRPLLNALGYVNSQRNNDIGFLDPRYAPPEYINGGQIGPWSDIYQIGLLLFELVTGRPPFVGRNPAETGVMQSTEPPPRMKQYKHDTPAALQEVIDHALAKNPAMRFTSIEALQTALATVEKPAARSYPIEQGMMAQISGGLTRDMPPIDDDIALRATLIEGRHPVQHTFDKVSQEAVTDAKPYAYLCYEKDGVEIQHYAILQKAVIIGRVDPKRGFSPDIDLSTLDTNMTVSRQHARIRFEETFFYIEDLKSRNKTRLGELTLTPLKVELLQHGDTVQFGNVRMKFNISALHDQFEEKKA